MEAKNRVEQLFLMTEISLNSKNVNLINDFLIRVKTALFRMMIGSFFKPKLNDSREIDLN